MPVRPHSVMTGSAGEYLVMGELLRRGYIAAKAPEGVPNLDIVVTDKEGQNLFSIQVKTRRGGVGSLGWPMSQHHEGIGNDKMFYVFVHLPDIHNQAPRYYVVPSKVVANTLQDSHQVWLRQPGRNGEVHRDGPMRSFKPYYDNLKWQGMGDQDKRFIDLHSNGWIDIYQNSWSQLEDVNFNSDQLDTLSKLSEEYRRVVSEGRGIANSGLSVCQCSTEKVVEQSNFPLRMRSYLLVGSMLQDLLGFSSGEEKNLAVIPRIQAHGVEGDIPFTWMCYATHDYDQKIDWVDVDKTIKIIIKDALSDERYGLTKRNLEEAQGRLNDFIAVNFSRDSYGDCPGMLKTLLKKNLMLFI